MASQTRRAPNDDADAALHARNLDQTLRELQQRVKEHEDALAKLKASSAARNRQAPTSPAASLEIMTAAYDQLAAQTPFLPFPDSVLPALVALRRSHAAAESARAHLAEEEEQQKQRVSVNGGGASSSSALRRAERASLADQEALNASLRRRAEALREGLESGAGNGGRKKKSEGERRRERAAEARARKRRLDGETSRLVRALRGFIEERLAPLLAAEGLGGPVVGDLMDVDAGDLAAGFGAQGRPRKRKQSDQQQQQLDGGVRQRRIDEIWGPSAAAGSGEGGGGEENSDRDETAAAAAEMRELTEDLLNALAQSQGDNSAAYVRLPRETAAARFLVRANVAQFHPRDATQLRMIDFGKELDD